MSATSKGRGQQVPLSQAPVPYILHIQPKRLDNPGHLPRTYFAMPLMGGIYQITNVQTSQAMRFGADLDSGSQLRVTSKISTWTVCSQKRNFVIAINEFLPAGIQSQVPWGSKLYFDRKAQ